MEHKLVEAEFIENRLVIWDPKEGSEIYKIGFFGKPIGIPKPKTTEFDTPLALDLIEALYLVEKGHLKVVEKPENREIPMEELRSRGEKIYEGFNTRYTIFKELKDHGYAVTPGIKFGCDFAVYEHGPGIDHAPYLVSVKEPDEAITATDIVRAGRLATTVRKRFIIAVPNPATGDNKYLIFKWYRA
jgi:tRNA-intron endonuclease, archaea type